MIDRPCFTHQRQSTFMHRRPTVLVLSSSPIHSPSSSNYDHSDLNVSTSNATSAVETATATRMSPVVNHSTSRTTFHLFSLPNQTTNITSSGKRMNPTQYQILRWKRAMLGDGGVYWDQRPQSLHAFNSFISQQILQQRCLNPTIQRVECAVLSTCSRFEILIAIQQTQLPSQYHPGFHTYPPIKEIIAQCLASQIITFHLPKYWLQNVGSIFLKSFRDVPSRISKNQKAIFLLQHSFLQQNPIHSKDPNTSINNKWTNMWRRFHDPERKLVRYHTLAKDVEENLCHLDDMESIARYFCRIASGLENSSGVFRPFSSRDSHVMQQIKQCGVGAVAYTSSTSASSSLVAVSDSQLNTSRVDHPIHSRHPLIHSNDTLSFHLSNHPNSIDRTITSTPEEYHNISVRYVKLILDSALQAGKACRSSKHIPLLELLREQSVGADGPIELSQSAARDAMKLVIEPTVQNCRSRFLAMENSHRISNFIQQQRRALQVEVAMDMNGSYKIDEFNVIKDSDEWIDERERKKRLHQMLIDFKDREKTL